MTTHRGPGPGDPLDRTAAPGPDVVGKPRLLDPLPPYLTAMLRDLAIVAAAINYLL